MLLCEDFERVRNYVSERELNAVAIKSKKIFVLAKKNGSMFRSYKGMETLRNNIGLKNVPDRILPKNHNGDILSDIVKKYSKFFQNQSSVEVFGEWTFPFLVEKYLHTSCKEYEVKRNNDIIAKEGALGAIQKNVMDYNSALKQENAFRQLMQEKETMSFSQLDVPNGEFIEVKFTPYCQYENSENGRLEAEKYSRTVLIKSHLGEGVGTSSVLNRCKHYVIYSESSGWGKSTFANFLVKNYNAQRITHVNNFCGIRENIQFLVLDEYGGGFSDENLKLITSGDASGFTGNRKSHGKGWTPRPDLQLIFLMNKCLFSYHGKYDNKLQQRVMDYSLRDTFRQRFIHVKLDSTPLHNEDIDILRYCSPSILSNEEKIKYFAYEYYTCCIARQKQRLENIYFCCGTDTALLHELENNTKSNKSTDKMEFVRKVQKVLEEKSKPLIKMYLVRLKKYVGQSLSMYISLSETDLDDMFTAIDEMFLGDKIKSHKIIL